MMTHGSQREREMIFNARRQIFHSANGAFINAAGEKLLVALREQPAVIVREPQRARTASASTKRRRRVQHVAYILKQQALLEKWLQHDHIISEWGWLRWFGRNIGW